MTVPSSAAPRSITVIGGGAVGGSLAVSLALAGTPVRIEDVDPDHLAAIDLAGLVVRAEIGERRARVPVSTPSEASEQLDTVLLAVPADQIDAAIAALAPRLAEDGVVVSFTSGFSAARAAERLGADRVLPAHIDLRAERTGPGIIAGRGRTQITLPAESAVPRHRVADIASALASCGPVAVSDHLPGLLWSQLLLDTLLSAASLDRSDIGRGIESHSSLLLGLTAELAQIAAFEGSGLSELPGLRPAALLAPAGPAANDAELRSLAAWARTGPAAPADRRAHGTPEILTTLDPALIRADRHGIPVPLLRGLVLLLGEGARPGRIAVLDQLASSLADDQPASFPEALMSGTEALVRPATLLQISA